MRILYVEDEPDIRQVAKLALEAVGGFTVEACSSGDEALRTLPRFKPDLILLDVMMPGMDGPTTLRRLRELPDSQGIPAVFMTAKVQAHEIAELKSIGAFDVIPKPFDPMTLSRTVSEIWASSSAKQMTPQLEVNAATSGPLHALEQIASQFATALPGRLEEIATACQTLLSGNASAEVREILHRSVHSLTGSAKTFGFPLLSDAARALELELKPLLTAAPPMDAPQLLQVEKLLEALIDSAKQPRQVMPTPTGRRPLHTGAHAERTKLVYALRDGDGWADSISQQLESYGYELGIFGSVEDLLDACQRRLPTALMVEVSLLQAELTGSQWTERLRQIFAQPPALIFVSSKDDLRTRLRAVQAGGNAYLIRPIKASNLVDRLDELSAREAPEAYRVMIVEDSREQAAYCSAVLRDAGMLTCVVSDPDELLVQLGDFHPELVLMDIYLPGCKGDDLARVIRQMDAYVGLPIVFLSVEADFDRQVAAMGLGGDEFLTKSILPAQLTSIVMSRVERYRTLRALMVQDSLTGLANHSRLHQLLETEVARALRHDRPLCLAMLDVDYFKRVNDRHGHPTGDRVLQTLARFLRQHLRQTDVVARYGGEEFALVLSHTEAESGLAVVDKLRSGFATLVHENDKGGSFPVTFSAGIASLSGRSAAREMILAADRALYEAKANGRNCVRLSAAPPK